MTGSITASRAIERQAAEQCLRDAEVGALVTHQALSLAMGADARRLRYVVRRAREELLREGLVFEAMPNEGYRRMAAAEVAIIVPDQRRRRIQGQARRAGRELGTLNAADLAELSENERQTALIGRSLFGAIAIATTARAIKAIRQEVARSGAELPVGRTIEALRLIG